MSLALPAAQPTRSQFSAPPGVLLDSVDGGRTTRVIAADTGNHRLLVWSDLPACDGADSAVVVGQKDPTSEGPRAGGRGPERGLHLPTGLARLDDLLLVADGWNHRVLAFDAALDRDDPAPTAILGQRTCGEVEPNAGRAVHGSTFFWPFGLLVHDGWLWVADTGNRRVLSWQSDVLPDGPADVVLGQRDFGTAFEQPHVPQGGGRMRFPYALVGVGDGLAVADTANNRVLSWPQVPHPGLDGVGAAASVVLGQDDLDAAGENRWTAVTPDSLCWLYALAAAPDQRYGEVLAVADSGNNRFVLWCSA